MKEKVYSGDKQVKKGDRSSFVTNKGVIYRKFKSDSHGEYSQLVVPKKYRDTVLKLANETVLFIYKDSSW